MKFINAIRQWAKARQVNKLLRTRAGLLAERRLMVLSGTYYPTLINELGQTEEHLRQLGWKEQ